MSERQHLSDPSELPFSPFINEAERIQVQMEFDLAGPNTAPYDYDTGVYNVADSAAHDQKYHKQLQATIEIGAPDPKQQEQLKLALDGQTPAMRESYLEPAEGRPGHNQGFLDLVDTATAMAAHRFPPGKDNWETSPERAAAGQVGVKESMATKIRTALDEDPSQIGVLLDRLKTLEDNAINANKAVLDAQAKAAAIERPLAVAKQQQHEGDPTAGDPKKDNVLEAPEGINEIKQMPAGYTSRDPKVDAIDDWLEQESERLHGTVRRFVPGAADKHKRIDGYVGEYRSRVRSAGLAVGNLILAKSAALTGNNGGIPGLNNIDKGITALGVEARRVISGADARKYLRFLEIVEGIDELNPDADPDTIVAKHTDLEKFNTEKHRKEIDPAKVEAYKDAISADMAEWRRTGSDESDHAVFADMRKTARYLDEVRSALDGMSEYNPRYRRLHGLHTELARIYSVPRYQQMRQRQEHVQLSAMDFEGRIEIVVLPDLGMYQEDGSAVVFYPDGSSAELLGTGRLGTRRNADGTRWEEPETSSSTFSERLRKKISETLAAPEPVRELRRQARGAIDEYYINPSEDNRNKAHGLNSAALQAAQAQAESNRQAAADVGVHYIDNPALRETINLSRYGALYHGIVPGEVPAAGSPHTLSDGLIRTDDVELYGSRGDWLHYPDGITERIEHGTTVEKYDYDGTRLI